MPDRQDIKKRLISKFQLYQREYPSDTLFVVYCVGPHCNATEKVAIRLAKLRRPVKKIRATLSVSFQKIPGTIPKILSNTKGRPTGRPLHVKRKVYASFQVRRSQPLPVVGGGLPSKTWKVCGAAKWFGFSPSSRCQLTGDCGWVYA